MLRTYGKKVGCEASRETSHITSLEVGERGERTGKDALKGEESFTILFLARGSREGKAQGGSVLGDFKNAGSKRGVSNRSAARRKKAWGAHFL